MSAINLPGGRRGELVPADDAGQFTIRVADGLIDQLLGHGLLTWRQAEALHTLGRLRRASGWRVAGQRASGAGERDPEVEARAARDFADLLDLIAMPQRGWLLAIVSTGEWPIMAKVSRVQDAADVVADRLGLEREA